MGRSKEDILPELEALIVEYMQAGTDIQSLMLDGFVLKARAIDTASLDDPGVMGTTIWLCPDRQDVFKTMGLADALSQDVGRYYDSLYDDAYNEDDRE